MYAIKCEGDFQDCDLGLVTRYWPAVDADGHPLLFATRREAAAKLAELTSTTYYDGIADHNILSHNQIAGYPPRVVRVEKRMDRNGHYNYMAWLQ